MGDSVSSEVALRLAIALGIGLLVGAERERRLARQQRRGTAGLRTFALTALLGGIAEEVGGTAILTVAFGFIAAVAVISYLRKFEEHPGLTTEIALLVTFLLGALAQREPALAAGIAVVITALLVMRSTMHRFVDQVLTEQEVHDGLLLLACALVVLPLVPDRTVDPLDVLNPFAVWRLVVLLMSISSVGYVAVRIVGPRYGLPLAGLAGGFVSSTATIGAMGTRSREDGVVRAAVAGSLASTLATFMQMAAVLAAASLTTLEELVWPLIAGGAGAAVVALVAVLGSSSGEGMRTAMHGRAFSLRTAVILALVLTGVTFAAAIASEVAGEATVILATIVGGFADTHAAAVAVASVVAAGRVEPPAAAIGILGAMSANAASKVVVAQMSGGTRFAIPVGIGVAASLALAWIAFAVQSV